MCADQTATISSIGNASNNVLEGQNGNDRLDGRGGNDTLTGGGNADTYVYADGYGADTITDFNRGQGDKIDLTGLAGVFGIGDLNLSASGGGTLITFSPGNTLQVNGTAPLLGSDFIFATANQDPTDILLSDDAVDENSSNGTVVGSLSAIDPDAGDTATFSLVDNAGGRFAISGNDLVVAGSLDYEAATSHQVTVRVTDFANNTFDETFTINVADANDVAPAITSGATGSEAENTAIGNVVYQATVTDPDTVGTLTYSLSGDDASLFDIDSVTGAVTFIASPDFEAPADLDGNNLYDIVVHANDGIHDTTQNVAITVTDVNDVAPAITSGATGSEAENTAIGNVVYQATVTDPDTVGTLTYSLSGDDASLFDIDSVTGAVTFIASPDFEAPADLGGNNVYDIVVHANDGVHDTTQNVAISVTNVSGTFVGTTGEDNLTGSSEEDTIQGLDGNDKLQGLNGNDTLDGGDGRDRASYADATGAIAVNLALGTVTGAGVGSDTLLSVEQVVGSDFADTFVATGFGGTSANAGSNGANNLFEGRGGNDIITGNGSTQVSYRSATATVTVNIGAGTATGDASVGTDSFTGVNAVTGSDFADSLTGSNGNDQFNGGAGNDTIAGGNGVDRAAYFSFVDDTTTGGVVINMAAGTVIGDASVGTDTLNSVETIRGSSFADSYTATGYSSGSNGNFNEFEGMGGNDTILGNGNTRIVFLNATGGVTVDLAAGTASGDASTGNDTINLNGGILIGGFTGGVNSVFGSQFADSLSGSLNANQTSELFDGRAGDDLIDGRGGFDTALYGNDAAVTAGISVAASGGGLTWTVTGDTAIGTDTLTKVESIRGTNFADSFDATGFSGASTDASLNIGTDFNEFEGLGGNDTITGNGNTRISFANATSPGGGVTVDLVAGTATSGNASIGNDTFTGVSRVRGSNNNDTISGDSGGNTLEGQGGIDTIDGREGNDTIVGRWRRGLPHRRRRQRHVPVYRRVGQCSRNIRHHHRLHGRAGPDRLRRDRFQYRGWRQQHVRVRRCARTRSVVANSITWFQDGTNTIVQGDTNGDAARRPDGHPDRAENPGCVRLPAVARRTSRGRRSLAFAPPLAHQAFLRHRGHQRAVAREDQPAREAARARHVRRVLGIEQPVVGAERAVQPQRVVEARRHDGLLEHAAAVRRERGVEQRHVGGVGEHALVDRRLVRQLAGRADPDVETAVLDLLAEVAAVFDRAQLDRPLALVVAPHRLRHQRQHALADFGFARQLVGRGDVRHLRLMGETFFVAVERHRHDEDRLAVLDRLHPPRGEALAVAHALDVVDDRNLGIAGEQEIGVQRMRRPLLDVDGAAGRDQRLADHLAAEHPLPGHLRRAPAEHVHLELFEVEDVEKGLDGGHGRCQESGWRQGRAGASGPNLSRCKPSAVCPILRLWGSPAEIST